MNDAPQVPEIRPFVRVGVAPSPQRNTHRMARRLAFALLALVAIGAAVVTIPLSLKSPAAGWLFAGLCVLLVVVLAMAKAVQNRDR